MTNEVIKLNGTFESFDKTPIYYEVRGEGEPIVFVYGIACLMNHWHHQVSYFSKKYKVITFDLRGHNKSVPLATIKHLKMHDFSKDIHGLLQYLNIPQAHFVGHSFGVSILIKLFDDFPHLFKSATFINGFAKNPVSNMFGLNIAEPLYHFLHNLYDQNPDLLNTLWRLSIDNPIASYLAALAGGFNLNLTHFKDIEVYARGVAHMDLNMFLKLFDELMKYNGTNVLKKINIPTLIISGEKDSITPRSYQEEFHKSIKNSEFLFVKYGSHCTQLDFPEFVNLKLESFFSTTNTPL